MQRTFYRFMVQCQLEAGASRLPYFVSRRSGSEEIFKGSHRSNRLFHLRTALQHRNKNGVGSCIDRESNSERGHSDHIQIDGKTACYRYTINAS